MEKKLSQIALIVRYLMLHELPNNLNIVRLDALRLNANMEVYYYLATMDLFPGEQAQLTFYNQNIKSYDSYLYKAFRSIQAKNFKRRTLRQLYNLLGINLPTAKWLSTVFPSLPKDHFRSFIDLPIKSNKIFDLTPLNDNLIHITVDHIKRCINA